MSSSIDLLLDSLEYRGINLGLERIISLLAHFDHPERKVPVIHVAGTNGKGSVCAYLASILVSAGYRVGLYTSPHLVDWNERISVNKKNISHQELMILLREIIQMMERKEIALTQFEVITAAAWLYFARAQVDIAVIEVGLGGRLDATNVVANPLLSIITSISLDHCQILGITLAQIAREKAGILKPDCPAVVGELPEEAKAQVLLTAQQMKCPVTWVYPAIDLGENWAQWQNIKYKIPLFGDVQLMNSALAIAAIELLRKKNWNICLEAITQGLATTIWQGRIQWLNWKGIPILIDGAHNQASAQALRRYVEQQSKPLHWIIGMISSKDHRQFFKNLLKEGDRLSLVPVPHNISPEPDDLVQLAASICPRLASIETYCDLKAALAHIDPENNLVVISGSLYLIGYLLAEFDQLIQS